MYADEEYLSHHGITGMRWGVKHGPPYPLKSSVSTGDALKTGAATPKKKRMSLGDTIKANKRKKQRAAALAKAREVRAANLEKKHAEEEHKANREDVIRRGTPTEVAKYKYELTPDEYREVLQRFQNEQSLKSYISSTAVHSKAKSDIYFEKVQDWTQKGEKLVDAYNLFARVAQGFTDVKMPIIPTQVQAYTRTTNARDSKPSNDSTPKQPQSKTPKQKDTTLQNAREQRKHDKEMLMIKNEQENKNNKAEYDRDLLKYKSEKSNSSSKKGLFDNDNSKASNESSNRRGLFDDDEPKDSSNKSSSKTSYEKVNGETVSEDEYWNSFESKKNSAVASSYSRPVSSAPTWNLYDRIETSVWDQKLLNGKKRK